MSGGEPAPQGPRWLSVRLVLRVFRDAARIFVTNLGRIIPLGLVVFGVSTLVQELLNRWVNHLGPTSPATLLAAIGVTLLVGGGTATFATLVFAGLLDYTVETEMEGRPAPPITEVLRRVPYLRLAATDLMVVALTLAGLLLLVIPGLIAVTLFGIAPPLVVAEDSGPLAAMRRSLELLRPRFGTALAVVLVPEVAAIIISGALQDLAGRLGFWTGVLTGVLLEATLLAFVALLLNLLAHHLRDPILTE
jgi:hypothetical protein